jgi:hypothetical protein
MQQLVLFATIHVNFVQVEPAKTVRHARSTSIGHLMPHPARVMSATSTLESRYVALVVTPASNAIR